MLKFNRSKVDVSLEKRILAGMIVSKKYMDRVYPIINIDYFVNPHITKVAMWVNDFYEKYQDVPGSHVPDILLAHKKKLKEEEYQIIYQMVEDLLSLYSTGEFNSDYLVDQSVEFFKKRELEIITNNVQYLLGKDELDQAEQEIDDFKKISVPTMEENGFLYSEEAINNTFAAIKDPGEYFFKMPKDLGRFIGDLNRGWLVGISAPFKHGKTWFLGEMAAIGALSGLRVVFFSLEMSMNEMRKRMYLRLTGSSDEHGNILFPCFDCQDNQNGSCEKPERLNKKRFPGIYVPESKYRPCCICKDSTEREDYKISFWKEMIKVPRFEYSTVSHKMKMLQKEGKANIWLKSKPRFSASVGDLERDLENLEYVHGFIPDIIVIDYADILQSDDKSLSGVSKEDEVWMCLARMASKRKALVLTATQLNKESLGAKQITTSHTAKWIGKLGHVDVMLALNQTPEEKEVGISRVSILEHRHKHFIQTQNCYVLQKFSVGQAHLDSYCEFLGGINEN